MNSTKLKQMKYSKFDLENCVSIPFSMKQEVGKLQVPGKHTDNPKDNIFFPTYCNTLNHSQITTMFFCDRAVA